MTQETTTIEISPGETILFGVVAVVMVALTVFSLLVTWRTVYPVVCVVVDMVCLAASYTVLGASSVGVAQITVYTGVIFTMFLFVFMMIDVNAADSTYKTLWGQRVMVVLGVFGFAAIAGGTAMDAWVLGPVGLAKVNEEMDPTVIVKSIFTNHALAIELTGAFSTVVVVGAMILAHHQGVRRCLSQAEFTNAKMAAYAQAGRYIGQKPPTGVCAESNSAAAPALTSGGEVVAESIPCTLRIRDQVYTLSDALPIIAAYGMRGELDGRGREVLRAHMPGMLGEETPSYGDSRKEVPAYGDPREKLPVGSSPDRPRPDNKEENH